jgi:hypothetical protein
VCGNVAMWGLRGCPIGAWTPQLRPEPWARDVRRRLCDESLPPLEALPESFEAEFRRRIDRADRLLHTLCASMRNAERREVVHERLLNDVAQALHGALGTIRPLFQLLGRSDENGASEELPPPLSSLDGVPRANVIGEHNMRTGSADGPDGS